MLLHRLFAHLAYRSHRFGILVKGSPDTIVRNGECDFRMMRRNHVSMHDLEEDMRLDAHIDDLSKDSTRTRGTQRGHQLYPGRRFHAR